MKGVKALTLHGVEYSSFCVAVELALELKGLEYEYVQEDLANKSEALLRYNPIHKKVPILVHHGKPIAESLVILEYIEETWKEPPLLPSDPYKRARVRFWIDFYYHKLVATSRLVFDTKSMPGDLRKIGKEIKAHFMTMEEGTKMDFPGEGPFFHGDKPGLLDVLMAPWGGWFVALRGITGVEVARKETTPFILSSITAFESLDVARGRLPDHDKMLEYAQALKARTLLPNTVS